MKWWTKNQGIILRWLGLLVMVIGMLKSDEHMQTRGLIFLVWGELIK